MTEFKTWRLFSQPPRSVFAALSSPERLARWWGPSGFSNTFEVFEFQSGGVWRFTMHGPDGTNYLNEMRFVEIESDCAVVVDHLSQLRFTLSIRLEPASHGTLVTWVQTFESSELAASLRHVVEPANEQNLDRWQAELLASA